MRARGRADFVVGAEAARQRIRASNASRIVVINQKEDRFTVTSHGSKLTFLPAVPLIDSGRKEESMFARYFLTAVALCGWALSTSADSVMLRCGGGNLSAKVSVDSPALLDREGRFKLENGSGTILLHPQKMEVKGGKVICGYSAAGVVATYIYEIPKNWECHGMGERQHGRGQVEFSALCYSK
jgi:hypothetical protein